jgi:ATP-binding cassette, subfamily B, bacterial CvaB/MchF/RaxB
MIECARIARIHDDIMAMPMSYNSLIGDMGSSLSSGQKQRILLARALYRRPKILFLDEGTAHLDTEKEKEINANLRRLNMTRVSVAHRPEITHGADMILHLAPAVAPLQVGVASRRPGAAPAGDAGESRLGAEGPKLAEAAQDHNVCSDGGSSGDHPKHGKDDRSKDGKDAYAKHDWKDARNVGEPKDDCEPHKDCCGPKPSDGRGKGGSYRNPGEALAKIDFSRW